MRDKLSQELASSTLRDALGRGNPTEGLIHHSDRGRQYAELCLSGALKRIRTTSIPSAISCIRQRIHLG